MTIFLSVISLMSLYSWVAPKAVDDFVEQGNWKQHETLDEQWWIESTRSVISSLMQKTLGWSMKEMAGQSLRTRGTYQFFGFGYPFERDPCRRL